MRGLLIILGCVCSLQISVCADMAPFKPDNHGKWKKPDWMVGKWQDAKQDAIYVQLRAEIERALPSRNRTTPPAQIKALVLQVAQDFQTKHNWRNFYRLAYVVARFPRTSHEQSYDLYPYVFAYSSPDSREYARVVFCALAMKDNASQVPKSVVDRLKASCQNDPTLQEALVRYYNTTPHQKPEDHAWALQTVHLLYNRHPSGRNVYGALMLDTLWCSINSVEAGNRAIKEIESLIGDGYLEPKTVVEAKQEIERIKKANAISIRKRRGADAP